jgi:hypothetical protein
VQWLAFDPRISRLLDGDVARSDPVLGSLIRHALLPASAKVAHGDTVVFLSLGARLMPGSCCSPAAVAPSTTALVLAVAVTAIAVAADEEDRPAPAALPHPQNIVVHVPVSPGGG